MSLREREFVDSARVAGASDFRIMFKHMLPNAMGVIIVNTTLVMSQAIVLEAALSYLGFGISPPGISWASSSANTRPPSPRVRGCSGGLVCSSSSLLCV